MTKNILIISILLFILSSISFGRVPIDENKIRITSTFGEFRTDHFHNGVDFGGSKMEIYPMADGEIVYYFDIAEDPTRQLYGVGNTIILEHPNGIRSYYYHIEDGTIEKSFAKVTERDRIANVNRDMARNLIIDKIKMPNKNNTNNIVKATEEKTLFELQANSKFY